MPLSDTLERLKTALADRYQIERELGSGGMATVYLADDPRHHRKVALKVLRPDLAATLGPERFLREVTIAANLQHPHILPVYDSGEAAGFLYYVMPYVEGQTLRDRLTKERELPVAEAVRILRDVADAMVAAHAKGVVHRDIKPENVMLSGRHALVADFGVAKAVSEATGRQTLTTAGVALGTPTYMAPEQAAADPRTDHRADLYAFGVMAYEMVTGQPPFVGATPQAVLAAHVTEAPVNVTQRRATIPPALAQLIMRCLEKKPADRPQSAEEVLGVVESLTTPSGGITPTYTQPVQAVPTPQPKRWPRVAAAAVVVVGLAAAGILLLGPRGKGAPAGDVREPVVVVPFEVQATDAQLANLGQQTADRISAAITEAGLGAVVPYRPTEGTAGAGFSPEVAERVVSATGAATLVTGVIYQRGDSLEVRAQVLRAADLKPLFSLPAERGTATSPERGLEATTQRVLGAVGRYLSPVARTMDVTLFHPPSSLQVFRLYDKANQLFRQTEGDSATRALLIEALRLDTTLYSAALDLAAAYANYGDGRRYDSIIGELELRRSRLMVGEAISLDYGNALRRSPEEEYRAVMAGFRTDSVAWAYSAMWSCVRANRPEEALRYYALRDTSTVWGREWQAWDYWAALAYHALGRFEEELAVARAARAREPRAYGHVEREARALAALGRTDSLEVLISLSHSLEWAFAPGALMSAIADELIIHGQEAAADSMSERLLAWVERLRPEQRALMENQFRMVTSLLILQRFEKLRDAFEARAREGDPDPGPGYDRNRWTLQWRGLAANMSTRLGDTVPAAAMIEELRRPTDDRGARTWNLYQMAELSALLGRKDDAVAYLREFLNDGGRLGDDPDFARPSPVSAYYRIRDYPPFRELVKVKG